MVTLPGEVELPGPTYPGQAASARPATATTPVAAPTIELDENDLSKRVAGKHLTIFVGRGVIQNSPYYVPNQGFNRAHVIANQLSGSGYSAAHNLVTTSEEYNQQRMAKAENNLVAYVDKIAKAKHRSTPGLEPTEPVVTFSLEVKLTYVDPVDRLVATKIANDKLLPDKEPEIREAILEKLREAGISKKLQRVKQTTYDLENLMIANQGPDKTTAEAGEDEWLLTKFGA